MIGIFGWWVFSVEMMWVVGVSVKLLKFCFFSDLV